MTEKKDRYVGRRVARSDALSELGDPSTWTAAEKQYYEGIRRKPITEEQLAAAAATPTPPAVRASVRSPEPAGSKRRAQRRRPRSRG